MVTGSLRWAVGTFLPALLLLLLFGSATAQAEPTVSFTSMTRTVTEGGNDGGFRLQLSEVRTEATEVILTYANETAADDDYNRDHLPMTIIIAAGADLRTYPITARADSKDESDETFTIEITRVSSGVKIGSPALTRVTIKDGGDTINPPPPPPPTEPVITIVPNATSVTEGTNTHAGFTVSASPHPISALTVNLSVSEDESSGRDFVAAAHQGTGQMVTVPTTGSVTHAVPIVDDQTDEPDGTVTVTVNSGTDYTVGNPATASVTVNDNDGITTPVAQFASSSSVAGEGAGTHNVVVNFSPMLPAAITLHYMVASSSTATAGSDYAALTGTMSVASGSSYINIPVTITDDSAQENAETVIVTLTGNTGYTVGSQNTHMLTINDNDAGGGDGNGNDNADAGSGVNDLGDGAPVPVPEVSFVSAAGRVDEGVAHRVAVRIDPAPTKALTVQYMLAGSASGNRDYTIANSGTVTVPAGGTAAVIRVATREDDEREPDETVVLSLGLSDGETYVVGDPKEHVLLIVDNDDPEMVMGASAVEASLVRFARTVTDRVLDRVLGRVDSLDGRLVPGLTGQLAGATITSSLDRPNRLRTRPDDPEGRRGIGTRQRRGLTVEELALGTGFTLSGRLEDGRTTGFWGGGSLGSYEGREAAMDIDGEVLSLQLGQDISGVIPADGGGPAHQWMAGLMLSRNTGDGDWRHDGGQKGVVGNTLTSLTPYGALDMVDGLRLWGLAGWGTGSLTLEDAGEGEDRETDTDWQMLAAGFRQDLEHLVVRPAGGAPLIPGLQLSLNGDLRQTQVSSDRATGLNATSGHTTRARLGLKGSLHRALTDGGTIDRSLELGLRYDGGDAETGYGVEVGGGVTWKDTRGIGMTVEGRTIAMHGNGDFEDHVLSASVFWDPAPELHRGLSGQLGLDMGEGSAMDSLLSEEALPILSDDRSWEAGKRWRAEASYGLRTHRRGLLGSSYLRLTGESGLDETRLGYRVVPGRYSTALEMDLFTHLNRAGEDRQDDIGAGLELRWRW